MNKNKSLKPIVILFVLFIAAAMGYWIYDSKQPGKYDTFASCLGEKGAKFYGAFWCSHCQNQKAIFGKSKDLLPYTECSTADSKGQTQVCKDKGISNYPTWEFATASGTELVSGEQTLAQLATKSGCTLPR